MSATKVRKPAVNHRAIMALREAMAIAMEDFDVSMNHPLSEADLAKQTIRKRGLSGKIQYNQLRMKVRRADDWVRQLQAWYDQKHKV